MTIYSHIFPDKSSKTKSESAAHSSRTLLRGGYQIPAVLKKSRGKANPFPPAKIALLCLVRISPRQIKKARSVFSFGVFLWRNSKCLGGTWRKREPEPAPLARARSILMQIKFGGPKGTRTSDLYNVNVAL